MTVQLADGITFEEFDPLTKRDVDSLQEMFTDYLLEEFQRINELAFGSLAAGYLITTFIHVDGQDAGFMALDAGRYAVEIIYVKPEYRGRGLATLALRQVASACPQKLALKTPLSPGGEALADQLDMARADNFPHEEAKNEEALRTIRDGIKATCTHGKRVGNPRKPCKRCYQKTLRRYAALGLGKYVAAERAVAGR
ncbi:GNAT family N-acetyltransferase [Streptomyces sp. NPDC052236]|uniref:GNAT family N-acetyltransferase n=1 Tax=Streptomyces sp. NPDC052236 TaxID=3365686 RepID=UPI0037D15AA2